MPETSETFSVEDLDLSLGAGSDPPTQPAEPGERPRARRRLLNRPPLSADALDAERTNRRAMRPRGAA